MTDTPEAAASITKKLEADLDRGRVKVKKIPGRPDADYLETYDVINTANAIFGYGGWGTKIINIDMVPVDGKTVCIATVQLDVDGCLPRQDVGVVVSAGDSPQALETAAKGAVSDGIKRNFRHFGKQFGNDLYAKGPVTKEPTKAARARKPKEVGDIEGTDSIDDRKPAPDAMTVKRWIHTKVDDSGLEGEITDPQVGMLNGLLQDIFGKDELGERDRHQFLTCVFGVLSSKELTKAQASVLISWAKDTAGNKPHPAAVQEAQMVLAESQKDAGQTEMPY